MHASLLHSSLPPPFAHEVFGFASILFCAVPGLFIPVNTSFVDELLRAAVICF